MITRCKRQTIILICNKKTTFIIIGYCQQHLFIFVVKTASVIFIGDVSSVRQWTLSCIFRCPLDITKWKMTSNDSGVDSSTDNDDCVQPQPIFSKRPPVPSTAAEMSVMQIRRPGKPQELPLFCFKPVVPKPMMFTRPPLIDEVPTRKLKCLFELATPSFTGTFDRFQSVSVSFVGSPYYNYLIFMCVLIIVSDAYSRVQRYADEIGRN